MARRGAISYSTTVELGLGEEPIAWLEETYHFLFQIKHLYSFMSLFGLLVRLPH